MREVGTHGLDYKSRGMYTHNDVCVWVYVWVCGEMHANLVCTNIAAKPGNDAKP